ncbi:MAG: hypothetical protein A2X79_00675 [Desulfuromonadaceae bacterium GWB2_53_15]|nr:MAG: hypothetical protein A2X79_00675 [Desulfuromonadaceae bacterium GWB2_53_15]
MRQAVANDNRISEPAAVVAPSSTIEPDTLDSGENSPGEGNEGTGRNLNGQAHLMLVQQHKTEQPASIAVPVTQEVREPLTAELKEHVVQQVKEHLAGHDYKPGTEQMCIRLTPENMGELKLNLKMENQQLKVEIVAENSLVRDALLKHSESLRETLAKQNITMESFNVVTSGGQRGFEQNDRGWKQLAQQQFMAGTSSGYRYKIPEVDLAVVPQYGTSKQYAMVDVHY